jgi:hypothetical protein
MPTIMSDPLQKSGMDAEKHEDADAERQKGKVHWKLRL